MNALSYLSKISVLTCAVVIAIGVFAPTSGFAGCNSGNVANTDLLSSANCEANAAGANSTAVGFNAFASGPNSTAFGFNAGPGAAVTGQTSIGTNAGTAFGGGPGDAGTNSVSVGFNAAGTGANSIAIGGNNVVANAAFASGTNAIAMGFATDATGDN